MWGISLLYHGCYHSNYGINIYTVLPALRPISSLFYHLIFSLHRWRSMKVAALIFCTHTHPCNINMNIK